MLQSRSWTINLADNNHAMWNRISIIFFTLAISVTLISCSTRQLYTTGQSWQRNQCYQLIDQQERERCLSDIDESYESYHKDSGTKD
ncbi:MAG: hypothetical protein IT526_02610, partial [Nitrosomonas sp.]|nr:hypothetical protein [Nitrosomonas sp.]